ncbi:MAG TPA: tetratricopeptide repeat protein [Dissulfurispiraceae bacterium]|nr:tetratricopeptide repeat protein [Dissulfurispiraceae bacterium]
MLRALLIIAVFLSAVVGGYYWMKSLSGPDPHRVAGPETQPLTAQPAGQPLSSQKVAEQLVKNEDPGKVFAELTEQKDAHAEYREMHNRARTLFEKGQFPEALVLLKQIEPRDKSTLAAIGYIHYHMRNMNDAVEAFEEALNHKPASEFNVRKKLVELYLHKGNRSKAREHLDRALALNAQNEELKAISAWMKREDAAHAKYVDEKSERFRVVFDGHEVGSSSRMVLRILDDAYRQIGRELNYFPDTTITVILYSKRDFRDVTRLPEWVGGAYGIFDGVIRIPVRGAEGQEKELRRVLFHEYTHALVHSLAASPPLWLNEGLAEYFSGGWSQRIGQHIPLTALHDKGSFAQLGDIRLVSLAYWESYSAVAYLIDRYGIDRVLQLIKKLGQTGNPDQAFRDALSISYRDLVETWEPEWKKKRQ